MYGRRIGYYQMWVRIIRVTVIIRISDLMTDGGSDEPNVSNDGSTDLTVWLIDQMGNEASTAYVPSNGQTSRRLSYDPAMDALKRRSKGILKEQRAQGSTESSDSGYGQQMVFQKNRCTSQTRRFHRQRSRDSDENTATVPTTTSGSSSVTSSGQFGDFLSIPQPFEGGHPAPGQMPRKGSYQGTARALIVASALGADRRRSRSLCNQQIVLPQAAPPCKGSATTSNASANTSANASRRASTTSLPSIARLRIQQCYKAAKPFIGPQILKRACAQRPEMRAFVSHLPDETLEQMGKDIHQLIAQCVASIEDADRITALSHAYGEKQADLCGVGFRPEYLSAIADASIAECVRLDNGAHKRCETFLAWSNLMESMFSGVRDGFYARIRYQRRLSLPQHRTMLVKQGSFDVRSTGMSLDSAC
uniref:Ras-GEF domain-containing protein n=1 Tax=Steinernema glaseri TaxID=37863 RepID=A0A1I8AUI3_9BILA